jgi:hypothetical protein
LNDARIEPKIEDRPIIKNHGSKSIITLDFKKNFEKIAKIEKKAIPKNNARINVKNNKYRASLLSLVTTMPVSYLRLINTEKIATAEEYKANKPKLSGPYSLLNHKTDTAIIACEIMVPAVN